MTSHDVDTRGTNSYAQGMGDPSAHASLTMRTDMRTVVGSDVIVHVCDLEPILGVLWGGDAAAKHTCCRVNAVHPGCESSYCICQEGLQQPLQTCVLDGLIP